MRVGRRGVALDRRQRLRKNWAARSVGVRRGRGRPWANLGTVGPGEGLYALVKLIEAGQADVGVGRCPKTR